MSTDATTGGDGGPTATDVSTARPAGPETPTAAPRSRPAIDGRSVVAVSAIALAAVLAIAVLRWQAAAAEAAAARSAYAAALGDVARLERLRTRFRVAVASRRPSPDLVSLIQGALVEAGLPITACGAVQPRGEQTLAGSARTLSVAVTLNGLTVAETGAMIAALRRRESPWRVGELQFTAQPPAPGASLDSIRYAVSVVLEATWLQEG